MMSYLTLPVKFAGGCQCADSLSEEKTHPVCVSALCGCPWQDRYCAGLPYDVSSSQNVPSAEKKRSTKLTPYYFTFFSYL